MKVRGKVLSGKGEGRVFSELEWAKRQFFEKLGFHPVPGTLNIRLEEVTNLEILSFGRSKALAIEPPNKRFCSGIVFPAVIEGKVKGAVLIPQVPDYDPSLLELIAPVNLRELLDLREGDVVVVEF